MKKLFLLLIVSLMTISTVSCKSETKTEGKEEPGFSFTAEDLDGNEVTEEIFGEKSLTLINVWATYCQPCLYEMPDLGELAADYREELNIVGIVIDVFEADGTYSETQIELAKQIAEITGADYLHILPSEDIILGVLSEIAAVPTTFFVDASGNTVGKTIVGARDKEAWAEIIDANLEIVNND